MRFMYDQSLQTHPTGLFEVCFVVVAGEKLHLEFFCWILGVVFLSFHGQPVITKILLSHLPQETLLFLILSANIICIIR